MFSNRTIIILYVVVSIFLWYDFLYNRLPNTYGPKVALKPVRKLALSMSVKTIESDKNVLNKAMHMEHLHHIPALKMRWMISQLLPCLNRVKIRNNTETSDVNTSAWVFPNRWGEDTIWINGNVWDEMPEDFKARSLIHECTHLILKTLDYAYIHQEKYSGLRGYNATYNADSITNLIHMISYFN